MSPASRLKRRLRTPLVAREAAWIRHTTLVRCLALCLILFPLRVSASAPAAIVVAQTPKKGAPTTQPAPAGRSAPNGKPAPSGKPAPAAKPSPRPGSNQGNAAPTAPPPALLTARTLAVTEPPKALELLMPLLSARKRLPPAQEAEVHSLMATALELMNYPTLALIHASWGLSAPHERLGETFAAAQRLSDSVSNDMPLRQAALTLEPSTLPEGARGEAFYLRGLVLSGEGQLKDAVTVLALVPPEHARYPMARLLMANLFNRMRQRALAVATLTDLTTTHVALFNADPGLYMTAQLNLARARFGSGDITSAIAFYESMPRTSKDWLEGQVELAWAYYRIFAETGELTALNQALGVLHGLNSPFFSDIYLLEPALLEAQICYQLCRFMAGSAQVASFLQRYLPLRDTLKGALKTTLQPEGVVLSLVLSYRKQAQSSATGSAADAPGGETALAPLALPPILLERFLDRPSLSALEAHLAELSLEEQRLTQAGPAMPPDVLNALKRTLEAHASGVRRAEETALRGELERLYSELNRAVTQAQLVRIEMVTAEKELYEAAAEGKVPGLGRTLPRKKHKLEPKKREVWPFEGEYWVDEVGYYRADAMPLCPE